MAELPPELHANIRELCSAGDALAGAELTGEAISKFEAAFELLPDPKEQWSAATWILVAIGDTHYLAGNLDSAAAAFRRVSFCPGWSDNAFIRLRRGQIALDLGDERQAVNELASAFMLGGYDIFDEVDDRYPTFVLSQMRSPMPPIPHRLACLHPDAAEASSLESEVPQPENASKPWWKVW